MALLSGKYPRQDTPAPWANGPSGGRAQGPEQGRGWPQCGHCELEGRVGVPAAPARGGMGGTSARRPQVPHASGPRNLSHTAQVAGPSLVPMEQMGKLRPREKPRALPPRAPFRPEGGGEQVPAGCGDPPALSVPVGNFPNCSHLPLGQDMGWGGRREVRASGGVKARLSAGLLPKARHAVVWPHLPRPSVHCVATPWSPGTQHCGPRCSACRPGVP